MPSLIRISPVERTARSRSKCKAFTKKYGRKCTKCVCPKSNPILNRIKNRSKFLGPVIEGMYRNCAKGCRQSAVKYRTNSAVSIQSRFRRNRARSKYRVNRAAVIRIQSAGRRYLARGKTDRLRLKGYRTRLAGI